MIVKRFGCTAIHNKALYKCLIHSFLCIFSQIEFCICKSLCICLKVKFFFAKQIVFICKTLDLFDEYCHKIHSINIALLCHPKEAQNHFYRLLN